MGGATYRGVERCWAPLLNDPDAPEPLKEVARELTAMTKVVFSKTINDANWSNTQIFDGGLAEVVLELKRHANSDILLLGSGSIVQQLAHERLIDDYIFIVSPVVAGEGKPLFPYVNQLDLALIEARTFDSGNVLLHYMLKK